MIHSPRAIVFDMDGLMFDCERAGCASLKGADAIVDFDQALRDPTRPLQMLAAYDSGDHLHPNDAGYTVMAKTVADALNDLR
jgi:lysophospholipase L1-like esterase